MVTNEADVVDELFGGPRDMFLATRTERAAQARASGDRDMARRIAALRKPTVAAWLVNQFVRRCPDDVDTLVGVAAALGDAHRHGSGDDVRAAGERRRELLRHLETRVRDLAGQRLSDDVGTQVITTFQAALIDPAALRAVCSGRLSTAIELGEDMLDQWPAHEVTRPSRPAPPPHEKPAPERAPEPAPAPKPDPELAAARQRAAARAKAATAARERAERDLAAAQQAVEQAETRLTEARAAFEAAREAHDDAREAVGAAKTALSGAVREENAAERAADALE
jgi:hypothetical protein